LRETIYGFFSSQPFVSLIEVEFQDHLEDLSLYAFKYKFLFLLLIMSQRIKRVALLGGTSYIQRKGPFNSAVL
jgi:hypothetical protein